MPFNVSEADVVAVFGADITSFNKAIGDMDTLVQKGVGNIADKIKGAGQAMTVGLTVPIAALAAGVLKIGMEFDDAFDRIRIGTGRTGEALAGLEQSFRTVVANVPATFEKASEAITQLAQRTGLTGTALETLTRQELELSRMTGSEMGPQIEATSKLFTNWAGAIGDPTQALDFLFKVSQQTGVGVTQLAADMTKAGAPLRALGFGFEESAVLIGQFDKAGVDAGKTTQALSRALIEMSKKGIKDPEEAFGLLIDKIKNSKTNMEALEVATKVFGARAGVQMVDAIKAGRFSIEEITKSLQGNKESILGAAEQTKDFSERLQEMRNQVFLAAEPLAKELFNALNSLMPTIQKVIGVLTTLVKWFVDLPAPVKVATVAILGVAAVAGPISIMASSVISSLGSLITAYNAAAAAAVRFGVASKLAFLGVAGGVVAAGLLAEESMNVLTDAIYAGEKKFLDLADAPKKITPIAEANTRRFLGTAFGKPIESFPMPPLPPLPLPKLPKDAKKVTDELKKLLDQQISSVNNYIGKMTTLGQISEDVWTSMSEAGRKGLLALSTAFADVSNSIIRMGAEMAGGQQIAAKVEVAFFTLMQKAREMREVIVAENAKINSSILELPVFYEKGTKGVLEILEHMAEAHAAKAAIIVDGTKRIGEAVEKSGEKTKAALDKTRDIYDSFFESVLGGWGRMINDTLKMLNGFNKAIPDSIGGIVEKIAGLFGASVASAQKWASSITGIVGGVATFMGSRNQGKVAGALGGAMAGASVGASIGALIGGPFAPATAAIGAGIGAIGGAILGLFGSGKSAAQKAEEERQKKAAEVQTAQAIANLSAGIIDGLEKGRQFLEKLSEFVAVPKEALKKFFKQMEKVLVSFVEMSAQFKSDGLAKAKEVAENLGPVFGFLIGAIDFGKAAREIEDISDEAIAKLMSAIGRIEAGFEKVIEKMETTTVKRAARLASKLTTVFSFITIIPEALKAVAEAPTVTDEILGRIFANATSIIDKFSTMVDTFHDYAMSKLAKNSKQFTAVFESVTSVLGTLKAIGEYQPIPDGILDAVTSDIQKVANAIGGWVDIGNVALERAMNLEDVVRRLRESLARSLTGINTMVAAQAASSVRTSNIQNVSSDNRIIVNGFTLGSGSDPRYEALEREFRNLFGPGGVGQIANSH